MFKEIHALRVRPGQKLMSEITSYCQRKHISSTVIIGIIGAVKNAKLGIPPQDRFGYVYRDYTSPRSILSSQGSISSYNDELVFHIHMILGGEEGFAGGHLVEAEVFSTAEVIIGELDYQLYREYDPVLNLSALCST